jgi:formylglycine-generating enzyme required for sulfatase activity
VTKHPDPREGLALGLCLLFVASCQKEPAPFGEALVVVDTDAPTETLGLRLRVDTYAGDGTWLDSREIARRYAQDWPASYSVFTPDEAHGRDVVVRLRLYPEGNERDYRGERFVARPAQGSPSEIVTTPSPTDGPHLVVNGSDVTPRKEPLPGVTIDRLVRVRLDPGHRGSVHVVLRSACFGGMADLAGGRTCVDTEGQLVDAPRETLSDDMSIPTSSAIVGTFGAPQRCSAQPRAMSSLPDGTPAYDEEACVPGGVFVLGSPDALGIGNSQGERFDAVPLRIAVVKSLRVDKYEVTVGRWRKATLDGFKTPDSSPLVNDGPLATASGATTQEPTWSTRPMGREAYPLNAVSWYAARAFCQFYGGDLLTEAQWEYVATMSGRPAKSHYAWGIGDPTCATAVFGRYDKELLGGVECTHNSSPSPFGVAPVTEGLGDATPTYGVRALGGSLTEWLLDAFASYTSSCWIGAPVVEPRCFVEKPDTRSTRGASWATGAHTLEAALRDGALTDHGASPRGYPEIGWRCARGGAAE